MITTIAIMKDIENFDDLLENEKYFENVPKDVRMKIVHGNLFLQSDNFKYENWHFQGFCNTDCCMENEHRNMKLLKKE
jgi:hypothetical protein